MSGVGRAGICCLLGGVKERKGLEESKGLLLNSFLP